MSRLVVAGVISARGSARHDGGRAERRSRAIDEEALGKTAGRGAHAPKRASHSASFSFRLCAALLM